MEKSISGSFRQPYSEPRMKVVDVKMAPLCSASNEAYGVFNTTYGDSDFD